MITQTEYITAKQNHRIYLRKLHRRKLLLLLPLLSPLWVMLFWAWFPSYYNSMLKLGTILQTYEQGDNRIEKD